MDIDKKLAMKAALLGGIHWLAHVYLPAPYNVPLYVTGIVVVGFYLLSKQK